MDHFGDKQKILDILDVGCAEADRTQEYGKSLKEKGFEVKLWGIDYSPKKCKSAKEMDFETIARGDMRRLPFRENQFDIVLNLYGPIAHLATREMPQAISEFRRVVRPNGVICVDVLGMDIIIEGTEETAWYWRSKNDEKMGRNYLVHKREGAPMGVVYVFTRDQITSLITSGGFELKELQVLAKQESEKEYLAFAVNKK